VSSRPTVYLSNTGSSRTEGHHGPGRAWSAQVSPRPIMRHVADGQVEASKPNPATFARMARGAMTFAEYLESTADAFEGYRRGGALAPGKLTGRPWSSWHGPALVADGDTLLCTCPRPGSKDWTRPCHLELLARQLVLAGWDVVLGGRRLVFDSALVVWDDTRDPYVVGSWPFGKHNARAHGTAQLGMFE